MQLGTFIFTTSGESRKGNEGTGDGKNVGKQPNCENVRVVYTLQ